MRKLSELCVETTKIIKFYSDVKRVTDDKCSNSVNNWNPAWNFCAETDRLDHTTKAGDSGKFFIFYNLERIIFHLSGAPIFAYLSDLIDRVDQVIEQFPTFLTP